VTYIIGWAPAPTNRARLLVWFVVQQRTEPRILFRIKSWAAIVRCIASPRLAAVRPDVSSLASW
jgi:hypothetical protein